MKTKFRKIGFLAFKLMTACSAIMMITAANSTACWLKGQDELPAGVKKYRKF